MTTLFEQALYDKKSTSILDFLALYEESLRKTGDLKDLAHATKLAEYRNIISNKSHNALRRIFDGFYNILTREFPDLSFRIAGRRKSFISVEQKILRNLERNESLDLIRDLLGVRIVLFDNNPKNCYQVMELFIQYCLEQGFTVCEETLENSHFEGFHLLNQFHYGITDYIANEKGNGYKSLHAVFRNSSGFCFEVQIRTFEMHVDAAIGKAAHDEYKKNKYPQLKFDREKIKLPGYQAIPEGVIDLIGLEYSVEVLQRNKNF